MELSGIYNIIYPQTNISMDIYGKSPCFMGKSNSMFMRKKNIQFANCKRLPEGNQQDDK